MDDAMADALEALRSEHGLAIDVEGRQVRLAEPSRGDPGGTVLRTLGLLQEVPPVSAAAHGPTGVAAGVWRDPELYLVRWTPGRRWVVGYKLSGGARPLHYVRTEGRIPTRFETGNWYGDVPPEVEDAFLEADLLLESPPFPPPAAPPPPSPSSRPPAGGAKRAAAVRPPRVQKPRTAAPPKRKPEAATRLCPSCRMHKAPTQFVAGSDLCVDCR
ncbi:MAG TPA: hypothetical protein VFJ85_11695 [Acidimicrobiales bacterium]|nr:hypothetical protein [Acidimicrobiales bacterium]